MVIECPGYIEYQKDEHGWRISNQWVNEALYWSIRLLDMKHVQLVAYADDGTAYKSHVADIRTQDHHHRGSHWRFVFPPHIHIPAGRYKIEFHLLSHPEEEDQTSSTRYE